MNEERLEIISQQIADMLHVAEARDAAKRALESDPKTCQPKVDAFIRAFKEYSMLWG